jgi:hypothetical protein
MGLESGSLSPGVTRMTAAVGALVSFQEGSDLLQELAGVEVEAKQVERTAEALGAEIAQDEQRRVEPDSHEALPSTLYLGIDGTGVPMRRSELKGRTGKQPDGSAKTREVKLCTVWSAESRDAEGHPVRDEGSVTYSAAIESAASADADPHASEFAQRVGREAQRRRFEQAAQRVVLGDGAPWIWNLAQELFPGATEIVDRFHVKQHLSEVAKALYPTDSRQAHQWAEQRHQELDAGQLQRLGQALRRHATRCEEARKCADYIQRNEHRMRYPEFHAQGLHLFGCGGGGLQGDGRHPAQACRYALDPARRQCHHCPALLSPECSLRGLLGTPRAEEGRVTLTTLMSCAPRPSWMA